jgi:flagellin-like protein
MNHHHKNEYKNTCNPNHKNTYNPNHKNTYKLINSKKGVSPLIATVLLIAFAVALGAVVMNWGSEYVRSQATSTGQKSDVKIKCAQDVDLSIVDISNTPKLCYNNETSYERIDFILSNDGNVQVESLKVTVISNVSAVVSGIVNATIPVGDTVFLNVSYDANTNGEPKEFRVLPQIKVAGLVTPVWCPKNERYLSANHKHKLQ